MLVTKLTMRNINPLRQLQLYFRQFIVLLGSILVQPVKIRLVKQFISPRNSIVVIEVLYDESRCLKFSHNAGIFSMCVAGLL